MMHPAELVELLGRDWPAQVNIGEYPSGKTVFGRPCRASDEMVKADGAHRSAAP
jgi:hypothetical protein